jgi:hypothetical protein
MESNSILCFICGHKFDKSEIQTHIFKDKLRYEGQKKVRLTIPDEYNLLFKTIKGGLSLQGDDVENFNNLISTKSVRSQANQLEYSYNSSGGVSVSQNIPRKSPRKSPPKKNSPPKRAPGQRPRGLICPLCGREYGTASLQIHMKSCRQKFELQQQDLPKNMRRSADKIIAAYEQNQAMMNAFTSGSGGYNIDAMNDQAFDTYNREALVPCSNCGRTFLPDRLIVHQRSCLKHPRK